MRLLLQTLYTSQDIYQHLYTETQPAVWLAERDGKGGVRLIIPLRRKEPCAETSQNHEYESDYDTCSVCFFPSCQTICTPCENVLGVVRKAHPFAMMMLYPFFYLMRPICRDVERTVMRVEPSRIIDR